MLCPILKQKLETIKTLQSELVSNSAKLTSMLAEFKVDESLKFKYKGDNAKRNIHKAEREDLINYLTVIRAKIDFEIGEIDEKLFSKLEKELNLKEQYNFQVEVLKNNGLIEKLSNGQYGVKDEVGKEYPIPDYKEVKNRVNTNKAEIEKAKENGQTNMILVPEQISMNKIVEAMKKKFKVYQYKDDLDTNVNKNDRTNKESHIIFIKDNIEADEELKNISADQLVERNIKGITLTERLLLELYYFNKTGKHLDMVNITLCSGSRDSDGSVPRVHWNSGDDGLLVDWDGAGYSDDDLRARVVVS